MPLFAPLNSSAAFKSSDKMYVHASRVSTSVRAVFSHPISLSLANQALHSPSPFCLIVHPFRIHPYCIYLIRLFRVHSYRTCVVGLFRTRFLRALSHANFRNARPIGLSQACLTSKLFRVHSHSTSHKSLHGKSERANAAQTMSRFCKKWQKFAVVNGLSTPKRPQRCFVFTKPQVTIYRRQEQCTPYRAQPQICAKKLTIRTKYQVRANCSRRHQQ